MTENDGSGVVKSAVKAGAEVVTEVAKAEQETQKTYQRALDLVGRAGTFLNGVFSPAAQELGHLFGEQMRFWRFRNSVRILEKAQAIIDERGRKPEQIKPLGFGEGLLIFEASSLEEDDVVQDLWARLMANAVDPERATKPEKVYVEILKALSSREVMFLELQWKLASRPHAKTTAEHGNPQHFIIEGERGIGKSSLCLWVDYLARGDTTYDGKNRLSFVVVNIELHAAMGYDDIVDAVLGELKRQIAARESLTESCKKAWEFLSRFQISGIKYDRPQPVATNSRRLDELTDVLVNLIEESMGAIEGVLILIDEADRPPSDAHLGQLCKLLTERLSRRRCERVCIGLSGLPDLMQKLRDSHESSLRIFNILELKPLEFGERMRVIDTGIEQANKSSGTEIEILDDAKRLIANLSEGYPHFLQEFAHCSFATDSDNTISVSDVLQGTFSEHGALNQLGRKYFADLYIDQIGSEDYRRVLIAMADHMDDWVGRQTIINNSGVKESIVNNALSALRERKIILSNPRARGEYRLPTRSFAVWIKARETQKKAEPALSVGDTASVINVLVEQNGPSER